LNTIKIDLFDFVATQLSETKVVSLHIWSLILNRYLISFFVISIWRY